MIRFEEWIDRNWGLTIGRVSPGDDPSMEEECTNGLFRSYLLSMGSIM